MKTLRNQLLARSTLGAFVVSTSLILLLTACDIIQPGLGNRVDITPPSLRVTPINSDVIPYIKGDITLQGTIEDDIGMQSVTVSYPAKSGGDQVVNAIISGNTWSALIPAGHGNATDILEGEQSLKVIATDSSAKQIQVAYVLHADNLDPVVLITSPYGYAATQPVASDTVEFYGNVYDASGIIAKVRLQIYEFTDANNDRELNTNEIGSLVRVFDSETSSKKVKGSVAWNRLVTIGTNDATTSYDINRAGKPIEGSFTYTVEVTDKAGNTSHNFFHLGKMEGTNSLLSNPSYSLIGELEQKGTWSGVSDINYLELSRAGELDKHRLIPNLAAVPSFEWDGDGNKPKIKAANLRLDAGFDDPANIHSAKTASIAISMEPGPSGQYAVVSGSFTAQYALYDVAVPVSAVSWSSLKVLSVNQTDKYASAQVALKDNGTSNELAEGKYWIRLYVEAANPGVSKREIIGRFYVSEGLPTFDEYNPVEGWIKSVPTGDGYDREIIIKASSRDILESGALTIVNTGLGLGEVAPTDYLLTYDGGASTTTDATYSLKIRKAAFHNKAITFRLTNKIGKVKEEVRTWLFDDLNPLLPIFTKPSPATDTWPSDEIDIGGSSADNTTVAGQNSGIAKVLYRYYKSGTPVPLTWNEASGTTIWNALGLSLVGSEGEYIFQVQSFDRTNSASTLLQRSIWKDTADPVFTYPDPDSVPTFYTSRVFNGNASDANSGTVTAYIYSGSTLIASKLIASFTETSTPWTITFNPKDITTAGFSNSGTPVTSLTEGSYNLKIVGRDGSGKSLSAQYRFVCDRTNPSVSATALSGWKSGTITIAGTALDTGTSGLERIEYQIDSTAGAWTDANGTGTWTASIDTDALTETALGSPHIIYIRSLDKAANTSTNSTLNLLVDRSTPLATMVAGGAGGTDGTTELRKVAFTLSGTSDDSSITAGRRPTTAVLSATKDGVSIGTLTLTSGGVSTGVWTYNQAVNAVSHANDGLYVYTMTVTDAAAKVSTTSTTVRIDTTNPLISITSPVANESFTVDTIDLTGTVSDAGSGINTASMTYNLNGAGPVALTPVGNGWTVTNASLGAEGTKTLSVTGADKLANSFTTATATFFYDLSAPIVAENTIGDTDTRFTKNASYGINGTLNDTNAVLSVTISGTRDGVGIAAPTVTFTPAGDSKSAAWSSTLNLASDGLYVFAITGRDVAGKTHIIQRTIRRDTAAPTIVTNALSGWKSGDVSISGTATDPASGSGLERVEYQIDSTAGAWTQANGTGTWSATIDTNTLAETPTGTPHIIYVRSVDRASNVTAVNGTINLLVDRSTPLATMVAGGAGGTDGTTELRKVAFTLSGTSDDSSVTAGRRPTTAVLSATKDGVSIGTLTLTSGGVSTGVWTYNQAVNAVSHANDGLYVYTITVTDAASKVSTATKTVRIDTTNPVTAITSPASNESFTTNVIDFVGTISDSGSGVDTSSNSMSYSLNGGVAVPFTPTGSSWTVSSVNVGLEGTKTLTVTGQDKLANSHTTATTTFYYDLSAPILTESTVGSTDTQATKNATFNLGGDLNDTNAVQSVVISATRDGTGIAAPVVTFTPAGDSKSATWSSTPSLASDGLYVFTITGRDVAGKTHVLQRTVRRDTIIPTVTINAAVVTNLTNNWQRSTNVVVSGTAADTATGISLVEWSLDGTNYTALTGTTSWSGTVSIPIGASNNLRIRSRDGAGNNSTPVAQIVKVDDSAPALSITAPVKYDTSTGVASGDTNTAIIFAGNLTDNLALAATNYLLVKPKKNNVAQADVALTLTGSAWTWTLNAPADNSADGTWELTFLATDSSGLTSSVTRTIVIETKKPVLTPNLTPSVTGPDKYNGTVAIKAAASDDNTLKGFYWQISTIAAVPAFSGAEESAITAGTALAGWTQSASATSLNDTWNSSAVGTAGDVTRYLWLAAGDRFGNIQSSSTAMVINQLTDRPALSFLNLTVSAAHASNNLGTTLVLNGSITDDDGVDKDKIFIAVAADANQDGAPDSAFSFAAVSGKPTSNAKTVSFSQNLGSGGLNLTQGYYVLRVKSGDTIYAGTIATEANAAIFSWNQSNIERFIIDTTPPAIMINEAQNEFKGTSFTLTGTASDLFGLQSNQIIVNGSPVAVDLDGVDNIAGNADDNTWSALITTPLGEGAKSLTVQATDISGQVSNLTYNYRRDSIAPTMTLSTVLSAWQLSTSVALAGTAADGGSGISKIEWSLDGTNYFQLNGTTAWNGIATIPNGASNVLRLRVTDQAGNSALYDADSGTAGQQNTTVKVDDTNPSFTLDSPVWYTSNSSGDSNAAILFSGTLTDNIALAATPLVVQRKKNNVAQANGASVTAGAGSWSWTMPVNSVTNADDGTWEITFVASDSSGRTTSLTRTINVETKKPVLTSNLTYSNITRSRYNGTVAIKASVTDDNSLIASYWQVSSSATVPAYTAADVRAGNASAGAGWTKSASASNLNDAWDSSTVGVAADATRYLWVLAADRFGNIVESSTTMIVNQTTDTPVVRFGNINAAGTGLLKRTTIVTGSVSDDDGVPTTIEASLDGATYYDISSADGSWSFEANPLSLANPDGNKTIRMRVTDAAGKVFTTDLVGGTLAVPTAITWPVAFKVDTQEPVIEQTVNIDLTPALADSFVELTPSMGLGGTSTGSFLIQTLVNDANGINPTLVKVKLIAKDSGGTTRTKTYNTTLSSAGTYPASDVYNSGTIAITGSITWDDAVVSALADGSATIQVDVEDNSGLKSSRTKTVLIDNTIPTVPTVSSPNLSEDLTGDVNIIGVATDATSGVAEVAYRVGLNAASESWISLGSSLAFNIGLTGASNSASYWVGRPGEATDANSDGIWDLPVEIRVTDKAGNIRTSTISLKVDPNGDMPKVQLAYPYKDGLGNWKALGGTIRLQGTSTDNNGIYDITVKIDANFNGNWTDDGAWSTGVVANGTNFWNLTINAGGEFNPTGMDTTRQITVRVNARDTKNGSSPDITGAYYEFPITIDKNVPKIGTAVALTLSTSQVALVSPQIYNYNMNIHGAWYLHGSIEDDNNVAEINVYDDAGLKIDTMASLMADGRLTKTSNIRYDLRFPIGEATVDMVDTIVYTLEAIDDTGKITQLMIKFNLDNKAPTMGTYIGGLPVVNSASSTYKINGEATNSAIDDGWVMDVGTSVEKVEVYLLRRGNGTTTFDRFYKARGKHTDPEWTTVLGGSTTGKWALVSGATKTMSDGTNPNYPGDSNYVIAIDSKTENGNAVIGDADKYVEWLAQTGGTKWSWWTDINAASIPDGPIEIHYVAYDTAGNTKHYSTSTFIQNNGPTVGAIWLGSDLNANTSINYGHNLGVPADTDEEIRYATPTGTTATSYIVKEAPMSIYLEVAQGNGNLVYDLTVPRTSGGNFTRTAQALRTAGTTATITLSAADLTAIGDGAKTFTIKIWDSTEETTPGTNSLSITKLISCTTKTNDAIRPTAAVRPFYWNSELVNSRYNNLATEGHIDIALNALGDSDSKVSGKISFRGTLFDDQRVTAIYAYIGNGTDDTNRYAFTDADATIVSGGLTYARVAILSSGTWTPEDNMVSRGWKFAIEDEQLDQSGHRIDWRLDWDSSGISGVAATNRVMRVLAVDKGNNQNLATSSVSTTLSGTATRSNTMSMTLTHNASIAAGQLVLLGSGQEAYTARIAAYNGAGLVTFDRSVDTSHSTYTIWLDSHNLPLHQIDVVPYVRSLSRAVGFNTIRSRQGNYVFRRTESMTVSGFNLWNSVADTAVFTGGSVTLTAVNAPGATKNSWTISVPAAARSGDFSINVSTVSSINNLNVNSLVYNKEASATPHLDGSTLWTDNRRLQIWQSDDTQTGANRGYFTGSIDPEYPAMTIDTAGVLYGSWSNYATSTVNFIGNNVDYVLGTNRIAASYDPLEHTDIAFGNRAGVIYNANTFANNRWELGGAGGVVVWDAQADAATSVTTGSGYEVEYLYHDRRLMQFINQRIAYRGDNIHVSYYDTETKSVKYWYGANNSNPAYSGRWINIDGGYDAHDGAYTEQFGWNENVVGGATITNIYVSHGDTVTLGQNIMRDSNNRTYTAPAAGIVDIPLIVGTRISGTNVTSSQSLIFTVRTSTNRVVDVAGTSRTAAAGEFSAIDVNSSGFPVIAYYDITNKTVKIARASAINPTAAQWTLQTVMAGGDPNFLFSGKYISMKIDSDGYVHLAFFRNSSGDLVYLKSTNNPTNGTTAYTFGTSVTVDTVGSVGVWTDLSIKPVAGNPAGGNDLPYISYLDSSLSNTFDGIKMAYYDPALEQDDGGAVALPDTADGWEYMNAALNFEVESVRSSIENDTGTNFWGMAIGYGSSDYFRLGYWVD